MGNSDYLVTLPEIAQYARVGTRKLQYWIKTKGFPAGKVDGQWRACKRQIDQWHQDQCQKAV